MIIKNVQRIAPGYICKKSGRLGKKSRNYPVRNLVESSKLHRKEI